MPPRPDSGPRRPLLFALGFLALAVIVLAVLTLADVGPFENEEAEQLGEQQFLAEGDEICRLAHEKFAELQREPPRTAPEAADLTANLVEISEQELDEIRSMEPPERLQEPLDRYLAAREEGIELLREAQEAAESGDAEGYRRAQEELTERQVERTKLAEAVGFTECSRPLTSEDLSD